MNIDSIKHLEPFWGVWYIKRKLGEGGFGSVYEIERNEFGNTFSAALKVISIPQNDSEYKEALADGMSEEETTDYFQDMVAEMTKEFALMDSVKGHTNIVDYADHMIVQHKDRIGWDILIRMELLTPLNDYILEKELDEGEVMRLGLDISKALEVCEKQNIIHRDIKPGNIFVTKTGEFKLGDFGIARVSEKTKGASTKVGTKSYIAPEIYSDERYDKTVDFYALGIVMYRFLNKGRLPFYPPFPEKITFADKEKAFYRRIKGEEEMPAPACANRELAAVVKKACAYHPSDRYQSASDMRADLKRIQMGQSVTIGNSQSEKSGTNRVAAVYANPDVGTAGNGYKTTKPSVYQTVPEAYTGEQEESGTVDFLTGKKNLSVQTDSYSFYGNNSGTGYQDIHRGSVPSTEQQQIYADVVAKLRQRESGSATYSTATYHSTNSTVTPEMIRQIQEEQKYLVEQIRQKQREEEFRRLYEQQKMYRIVLAKLMQEEEELTARTVGAFERGSGEQYEKLSAELRTVQEERKRYEQMIEDLKQQELTLRGQA